MSESKSGAKECAPKREGSIDQNTSVIAPVGAVYRRRGRDCTFYYTRTDDHGWVERAIHDDGRVGGVYVARLPRTADLERVPGDLWPVGRDAPAVSTEADFDPDASPESQIVSKLLAERRAWLTPNPFDGGEE